MQITDYIKTVGRGKTLGKHLSFEHAKTAMERMLNDEFTDAQLGAFLQALRIQELSEDELSGFASIFIDKASQSRLSTTSDLCLNFCFDTARKSTLLSLFSLPILCSMGLKVTCIESGFPLTGNTAVLETGKLLVAKWAADHGLPNTYPEMFVKSEELVSGLLSLHEVREQIGFRSCLHTLEKVLNIGLKVPMCTAISHPHYIERLLATLNQFYQGASWVVLGQHGTLDLSLQKDTPAYLASSGEKQLVSMGVYPESIFVKVQKASVQDFAEYVKSPPTEWLQAIAYQTAFFLQIAGVVETIEKGVHLAAEKLELKSNILS